MVGKTLVIVKKERDDPIPDYPIKFPAFDNLHLELLENKKKLKKGLPLVPLVKKKPVEATAPKKSVEAKVAPKKTPVTSAATNAEAASKDASDSDASKTSHGSQASVKEGKVQTLKEPKVSKESVKEKKGTPSKKPSKEESESDKDSEEDSEGAESGKSGGSDAELLGALADGKTEEGTASEGDEVAAALKDDPQSAAASEAEGEEEGSKEGEEEAEAEPEEEDEYAGLTPEEREAKEKEEYMWRFRILKKKYKAAKLPEFNEHSDLQMMKTTYNRTVKELYLDESVDSYRNYLIGGFVFLEFISTQWIGIDLKGFTKQQAMVMNKYEPLLVELGERSYNRWGLSLPVEVRLIGFILLQAAIFYVGKIVADKAGNAIGELFRGVTGQPPAVAATEEPKMTKMRGPSVSLADIKGMSATKQESAEEAKKTE